MRFSQWCCLLGSDNERLGK